MEISLYSYNKNVQVDNRYHVFKIFCYKIMKEGFGILFLFATNIIIIKENLWIENRSVFLQINITYIHLYDKLSPSYDIYIYGSVLVQFVYLLQQTIIYRLGTLF